VSDHRTCPMCGGALRADQPKYCGRRCAGRSAPRREPAPLAERFWPKVQKTDGCWLWMGALSSTGYGSIYAGGARVSAHCVAYELVNGPIPTGMFVLHRCDNRRCCNPAHLFLGTAADNAADMVAKGRHSHGARHAAVIPRGTRQHLAKLDEAKVRAIREARASEGASYAALARRFGVSPTAISRVVQGTGWTHVEIGVAS
jgi:hypothetical protein